MSISKISQFHTFLKVKSKKRVLLIFSFISISFCWCLSSLHYLKIAYGNNFSWITWIIAVGTFLYSFFPKNISPKKTKCYLKSFDLALAIFLIILYWPTHLWNFSSAPWNINGLFDDAAWDIYFAKNHIFNGTPFQPAFFDTVGYISREVVFHYYISLFFKLFGYNLLIFNISLLILGFITVFITTFIIDRLFKNKLVTILSAIIFNFLPFHYLHIFMGHRYAIAAPLMVLSLYFLYTSFDNKSPFRAGLSALFAALCWNSAIMGKQFILGLFLAGILKIIFDKKWRSSKNINIALVWISGFIICATPLLVYVIFNYPEYTLREKNLSHEFFLNLKKGGLPALNPYFKDLSRLFFTKYDLKFFLPGFYPIPLSYYFLLIPGLFLSLIKKRFEIFFLSLIPVFAAFISKPYDFRVLLAVPAWIISIAFSLDYLSELAPRKKIFNKLIFSIGLTLVLIGLIPSVKYIWRVSKNPNYLYLLNHKDVAICRLFQDIVEGKENPADKMKWDEFNRKITISFLSHDTFICPFSAYAIAHLYLQNYDDKKILSFCDQGIQLLQTPQEILKNNIQAILAYKPSSNKDLKLVWEISDKIDNTLKIFSRYQKYGGKEIINGKVDGNKYSLYILTIKKEFIQQFQEEIRSEFYEYQNIF